MQSSATDTLLELGDPSTTILSARRALQAIFNAVGGIDRWAQMVAEDMERTAGGSRVAIHRAILTALLKIDEAEVDNGEIVDEQADAIVGRLNQVMAAIDKNPDLLDRILEEADDDDD